MGGGGAKAGCQPRGIEFLDASRARAQRQLDAVRRTNGRLRRLSVGLAAVLLLAVTAA